MSITIWHNPRCSKSRQTLALIEARGVAPHVRLYLKDVPDIGEIAAAVDLLEIAAIELVRRGEKAYRDAQIDDASPERLVLAALAANPILIERPIVFANGKAAIGRPPEAVLDIL